MTGTVFHQMAILGAIGSRVLTLEEVEITLPLNRKKTVQGDRQAGGTGFGGAA